MNILFAIFCVMLFSMTVPFTRIAALEMPPMMIMALRLSFAGLICGILLLRERWLPPRRIWLALMVVSLSAVTGYTLLLAFALKEVPGSHGAISLAALPAGTALYSSFRDRLNPGRMFWVFAILGVLLSVSYFFSASEKQIYKGDFLLLLAVLSATIGYVEGGRLSREFGGLRIMSWAVLLALPIGLSYTAILYLDSSFSTYSTKAWFAILYLAFISQSLGMILWYRVLALGPMEKIALVQLIQPFFTLIAAVVLLHEQVEQWTWILASLVMLCIVGASRSRRA